MSTKGNLTAVKYGSSQDTYRIKADLRDKMKEERNMRQLSYLLDISFYTIRKQVNSWSPDLCLPQYADVIRKILGLPSDYIIYDTIKPETHLHE